MNFVCSSNLYLLLYLTRGSVFSTLQLIETQPHLGFVSVHGTGVVVLPCPLFQGKRFPAGSDSQISDWDGGVPKFKTISRNMWQKIIYFIFRHLGKSPCKQICEISKTEMYM